MTELTGLKRLHTICEWANRFAILLLALSICVVIFMNSSSYFDKTINPCATAQSDLETYYQYLIAKQEVLSGVVTNLVHQSPPNSP